MSKLTEFYTMKSHLYTEGQGEEAKWNEFEDKLIREELLPEMMALIKPLLSQVKSPLSVQINYAPNGSLAITATRNCIQAAMPLEAQETPTPQEVTAEEPDEATMPTVADDVPQEEELDADVMSEPIEAQRKKKKSVGIVVKFGDGTVIHENKAVQTWLKALRKIGLDVICNNSRRHEAWHVVDGKDICIVDRVQTFRKDTSESPQTAVDGYFVMTQLSNLQKIKDLNALGVFLPNLGIKVEWEGEDDDATEADDGVAAEVVRNNSRQYDRTKYALMGGTPLKKRRFALALVRQYVKDHPAVDYAGLKRVFRPEIIGGRGVVRSISDLDDIRPEEQPKRYMMKEDELIYLPQVDDIITVCSQWNFERIAQLVEVAKSLGYEVSEVDSDTSEE